MNIFTYIKLGLKKLWNPAQCYVPAWMGGGFGEELIHVYVWLSAFAIHLKTLLIGYTPVQNNKFKGKKGRRYNAYTK